MRVNYINTVVTVLVSAMVYKAYAAPTDNTASNTSVALDGKNNDSVSDTQTEEQISKSTTTGTKSIEKGPKKDQEAKIQKLVVETKTVEIKKVSSDAKAEPKTKTVLNSNEKISDIKQAATIKEMSKTSTRENPIVMTEKQSSKVKSTVTNTDTKSGVMSRTVITSTKNSVTVTKDNKVKVASQSNQTEMGSKKSPDVKSNQGTISQPKQIAIGSKQSSDDGGSNQKTVSQSKRTVKDSTQVSPDRNNQRTVSQTKQIIKESKTSSDDRNNQGTVSQTKQIVKESKQTSSDDSSNQGTVLETKRIVKESKQFSSGDARKVEIASQTKPTAEESLQFSDGVASMTTTESTVTDPTDSMTKCNENFFRPHPDKSIKSKYQAAVEENIFEDIYLDCPASLVWHQELCICDWPPPEPVLFDMESCKCCDQGVKYHPSDPTMFQQLVNGKWIDHPCSHHSSNLIWNNDTCQCVWDPKQTKASISRGANARVPQCKLLVNMTLDEEMKDSIGRSLRKKPNRVKWSNIAGSVGKSMEIRGAPFDIDFLHGNELQSHFYFKFNFKIHDRVLRQRKKMVILTNGCIGWYGKRIEPSLEVSFFPFNETFEVVFASKGESDIKGKTVFKYKEASKNQHGWYKCVLYLQNDILVLKVNGKKLFSTNGLHGGVKSTSCRLKIAGSFTNRRNHFHGYLDELILVKDCLYEKKEETT